MEHDPLFYATYQGPLPVARVGIGLAERGYPGGVTIQIGADDAEAIREQEQHEFKLEPVPAEIIGTAEEAQPTSSRKARELHQRLLKFSHDIDIDIGED